MSKALERQLLNNTHFVCRTVVIPDDPETEELLDGSPHANVALAIADLMRNAERSVSIGIEGRWGAGKSTVIKLLMKELNKTETSTGRVFTIVPFDAWTHEGDPLRRSFLEALIEKLMEKGWIERDNAQERLDILAQRLEKKTVENLPTLTRWGRVIAASLFLVPIGSVFLTRSVRDIELTFDWSAPVAWRVIFSLLLMTCPLWLALVIRLLKNDDSIWSILFSKITFSTETSKTRKTPNPTSNEFARDFNYVMGEALAADEPNRNVAVIVDNLDRVDAKDALSLWSTLQTFVKQTYFDPPPWLNRLWIVVAFDPDGIRKLWQAVPEASTPTESTEQKSANNRVSSAFLDKSFQVRFEVPPPVLSGWRYALFKFLGKAFPETHHEGEFHAVHNILAIHFAERKVSPTIRELKLIVNHMGVIHRQWVIANEARQGLTAEDSEPPKEFPLSHLAYYVLLKRSEVDIIDLLRAARLPAENYKDVLADDISDTLASLVFNVEKKRALEIILGKPIEDALIVGEHKGLIELSKSHEGFWDVLQTLIDSNWLGGERVNAVRLSIAVKALSRSGLIQVERTPLARKVVITLLRSAKRVKKWPSFDEEKGESLYELCRWNAAWSNNGNEKLVDELEAAFLASISESLSWHDDNAQYHVAQVTDWLEGVEVFRKNLNETGQAPFDVESVIISRLSEQLKLDSEGRGKGFYPGGLGATLEALYRLGSRNNEALAQLRPLVYDNAILKHLRSVVSKEDPRSTAWCLFVHMVLSNKDHKLRPDTGEPYATFIRYLSGPQPNVTMELVDIVTSSAELAEMFEFTVATQPAKELLREYLKTATSLKRLEPITFDFLWGRWIQVRSLFDKDVFFESVESIDPVLGADNQPVDELLAFVVALIGSTPGRSAEGLRNYVMAKPFRPNMVELYAALIMLGDGLSDFQHWLEKAVMTIAPAEKQLGQRRIDALRHVLDLSSPARVKNDFDT